MNKYIKSIYHIKNKGEPFTNRIDSCNKQGCSFVILDLSKYEGEDLHTVLKRKLCGELKEGINKNIQNVIVIKNNNVSKITRKQIQNRDFSSFLKGL